VADARQFEKQFGDRTEGNRSGDSGECARCEAMLADALDGTLSAAEQERFDAHVASCGPCAQLLADARRGVAWLEMLRNPAPEPPAALLEKILAQTSGAEVPGVTQALRPAAFVQPTPAMAAGYVVYGQVIPFPRRAMAVVRGGSLGQIMRQPRLAMTAAMAFLSIALTMDLTGVNPLDLRAGDVSPSSLKRDFFEANARVVQYYEGLRVVYELESRVHDLQSAQDSDAAAGSQQEQTGTPAQTGTPMQSGSEKAGPENQKAAPESAPAVQPESHAPAHRKTAPDGGTNRSEEVSGQRLRLVAETSEEEMGLRGRMDLHAARWHAERRAA
jgi:hypothetical protein